MKHFGITSLAAAALVALVAAGSGSAARNVAGAGTFELTVVQKSFVAVPAISRKTPPSIGGRMIFENVLYNRVAQFGRPAGARIGTAEVLCTIMSRSALECSITADIPGGQIVGAGMNPLAAKASSFAVLGGTGAYADARGSSSSKQLSSAKQVDTLRLSS